MYRRDIQTRIENMSYEEQKRVTAMLDNDMQAYDDNCNVIEVTITALTNAIESLCKLIFK